jgi:histone deacetylase 1/2
MRSGGHQSSVNMVARGGRHGGPSPRGGRGGGGRHNGGRGGQGRNGGRGSGARSSSFQQGLFCQICGKEGHPGWKCYNRYDSSATPTTGTTQRGHPPHQQHHKSVSSATTGYGVDTNWYMDTGATDHITSDLEKLTVHDKYYGGDQVHTASG